MKRKNEFRTYLQKRYSDVRTIQAYITYCKKIEETFGGKDMDDIIVHYSKEDIRAVLSKVTSSKKSIGDYMTGLNHYLKFAFEQGGVVKSVSNPEKIVSFAGPIVQYYFDVPTIERDEMLRKTLEAEYPKILQFAEEVFLVNKEYIPVYLSKETPPARVYRCPKKFIDELRKRRQEQRDISDSERRLMDEIIERKVYVVSIVAQFFYGEKPYIEIYYKNLPRDNRLECAINCLAHEYMHFLEYEYCFNNGGKAFADDRVSEALAGFFGAVYSIKRGGKFDLEVAWNSYVAWSVLSGSGWPYAFALYFYTVKGIKRRFSSSFADYITHGSINKMLEVFHATPDAVDAYNKLIKL